MMFLILFLSLSSTSETSDRERLRAVADDGTMMVVRVKDSYGGKVLSGVTSDS